MKKKVNINNQNRPNLYDYLKVIAIICMIIDHIGYYLFPGEQWLRFIGRIAFPIFLFLVGFNGSYRWKRNIFFWGIGLWVLTIVLNYFYGMGPLSANILIVIMISRSLLSFLDKKGKLSYFIVFSLLLLCGHFRLKDYLDYGSLGFFFALRGYIAKNYRKYFWIGVFLLLWLFIQNIIIFDFGLQAGKVFKIQILFCFFVLLFFTFYFLSKKNCPILLQEGQNKVILWISKHALSIYGIHIIILLFLALWKFMILV